MNPSIPPPTPPPPHVKTVHSKFLIIITIDKSINWYHTVTLYTFEGVFNNIWSTCALEIKEVMSEFNNSLYIYNNKSRECPDTSKWSQFQNLFIIIFVWLCQHDAAQFWDGVSLDCTSTNMDTTWKIFSLGTIKREYAITERVNGT